MDGWTTPGEAGGGGASTKRRITGSDHQMMMLERVIGNTIRGSASVAVNPVSGDVAYPAGCVIVFYSPKRHRQIQYLSCLNNRPLSCVCFSHDGKHVAAGEGGRQPSVLVWDVKTGMLMAELKGHSFAVNAIHFSHDCRLLASVGSEVDGRLNVWEWETGNLVANSRVVSEVRSLAFSEDGQTLVSAGSKGHLKHWAIDKPGLTGKCKPLKGRKAILEGGPMTSGDFVDVCFSRTSKLSGDTYALSSDGFLLAFDANRVLDKWVNLKSRCVHSLSATDRFVACACNNGLVRMFHPATLEYVCTLPKPPPFTEQPQSKLAHHISWPDAIAVSLTSDSQRAVCAFSDRSIFVWDVRDPAKICRCRALHAHGGSVWDLEFASAQACANAGVPVGSFFSCSSDRTIRLWSLPPVVSATQPPSPTITRELRAVLHVGKEEASSQDSDEDTTGGGVRCLRISPDGTRLACGDRAGNLRVYAVKEGDMELQMMLEAHDSEVMCVEFSGKWLATCSRDRLVHVFDSSANCELVRTFDEHSAAVTSVKFAARGKKLISCGADKWCIFRSVDQSKAGSGMSVANVQRQSVQGGTVFDMAVDSAGKVAITGGQDKQLSVWDTETGSRKMTLDTEADSTLRVRMDPSGTYAATSGSDRGVRLHEIAGGSCKATVHGHSEPVTGLAFSHDGERLASASGDGCIFIWRLPKAVTQAIKEAKTAGDVGSHSHDEDVQAGQQQQTARRKPPTTSELSAVQVRPTNASVHESQKTFLNSLLDQSLRDRNMAAKGDGVAAKLQGSTVAGPMEKQVVLNDAGDLIVTNLDEEEGRKTPGAAGQQSGKREGRDTAAAAEGASEFGEDGDDGVGGEAVAAGKGGLDAMQGDEDDDEEFIVARSEGVFASYGVDASKPADMVESDDEGDGAASKNSDAALATEDIERTFLKDNFPSLGEKTFEIDPRVSVRMSMSVSYQLKKQIQQALHINDASADNVELTDKEDEGLQTPQNRASIEGDTTVQTASSSVQATPDLDRTAHLEGRAHVAHARNQALAREIENMRMRLQAMGMCVGGANSGVKPPTPNPSTATSVAPSPAKPAALVPRHQQANTAQAPASKEVSRHPSSVPSSQTTASHSEASTNKASAATSQQNGANSTVPSDVKLPAASRGQVGGIAGSKGPQAQSSQASPSSQGSPASQPSLFAKMRTAGAVKAAERAEAGIASNAGVVYKAVEEDVSLREARDRLKEEARKRVVEELEQRKQAEDEARKEKFRGAKEEAEVIRERLKELERRKAEGVLAAMVKAQEEENARVHEDEEKKRREIAEEAERKKKEVEDAKQRAAAADRAVAMAEAQKEAELEAQKKAQEEAHKRAEMEARKKAEAIAQRKAQAEAQRKADEEKQKREQETKKKEDEAKRKAEGAKREEEEANTRQEEAKRRAQEEMEQRQREEDEAKKVQDEGARRHEEATVREEEKKNELQEQSASRGSESNVHDESSRQSSAPASASSSVQGTPRTGQPKKLMPLPPKSAQSSCVGEEEGNVSKDKLAEGVIIWAAELGVKVVSNVKLSGDDVTGSADGQGEDAYADETFEVDDGIAEGGCLDSNTAQFAMLEQCSVQVNVTSGAEVMEMPSGAGELEEDVSFDLGETGGDLTRDDSRLLRSSLMASERSVRASFQSIPEEASISSFDAGSAGRVVLTRPGREAAAAAHVVFAPDDQVVVADAAMYDAVANSPDEGQQASQVHQDSSILASPDVANTTPHSSSPAAMDARLHTPSSADSAHASGVPPLSRPSTAASRDLPPLTDAPAGWATPVPGHMVGRYDRSYQQPSTPMTAGGTPVLQPARQADPNHPLRPGTANSPLDDSVCTSNLDESIASQSRFEDLQPADKLISSVSSALDALNVARASNNRFAIGHLVEVLAQAQARIYEAIGPDVSMASASGSRAPSISNPSFTQGGTPSGVPALMLRSHHTSVAASLDDCASSALPSARSSVDFGGGRMDPNLSVISGQSGASNIDIEGVLERYSERLIEVMSRKISAMSMDGSGSFSVRASSQAEDADVRQPAGAQAKQAEHARQRE